MMLWSQRSPHGTCSPDFKEVRMLIFPDTYSTENKTKTIYLTFYLINRIDISNYIIILNLIPETHFNTRKVVECSKTPVWNNPQINRFTANQCCTVTK